MQSIKARRGQTLLDVALEATGTVEAAWDMARQNERSVAAQLPSGLALAVPDLVNRTVLQAFRADGIAPASEVAEQGGIGMLTIDVDFIVL